MEIVDNNDASALGWGNYKLKLDPKFLNLRESVATHSGVFDYNHHQRISLGVYTTQILNFNTTSTIRSNSVEV